MATVRTVVYHIACFEMQEVRALDGSIITKDGTLGWLAVNDGYYVVTTAKGGAYHFDKPISVKEAAKWDGMPWYHRGKPGTLKHFKVTEVHTATERTEEGVPNG